MKLFMEMAGEIFSLERTAKILETDKKDVISRTQVRFDPRTKKIRPVLQASAYFESEMELCRRSIVQRGGEYGWGEETEIISESLSGLFDLCFLREGQPDTDGCMTVHRLESAGKSYALATGDFFLVNVREFVFTRKNLTAYMKSIGMDPSRLDSLVVDRSEAADVLVMPVSGEVKSLATQTAKTLADMRHNGRRPSARIVNIIVERIKEKEKKGAYWHQAAEADQWLTENKETKVSRNLLVEVIKNALPSSIIPKVGRSKKQT